MTPGQEANCDNLDFFPIFQTIIDEAILMRTHNIRFHDNLRKFP